MMLECWNHECPSCSDAKCRVDDADCEYRMSAETASVLTGRLAYAETILLELATGYWVSVLDEADDVPDPAAAMGQQVLRYWQKYGSEREEGAE